MKNSDYSQTFSPTSFQGQKIHLCLIREPGELSSISHPRELEPEELNACSHSRFCKVEAHPDFLLGTIRLPSHKEQPKSLCLVYVIWQEHLLILDASSHTREFWETFQQKNAKPCPGIGQLFHDFLSHMISGDLPHLEDLEQEISVLENQVLDGKLEHFHQRLLRYRREITALVHYYSQMADMVDTLRQNESRFFSQEELRLLNLLETRLVRLKEETYLLREYALQIREVYQAQLDLRQNSIMQTLTMVTTLCLPLSLITGWYGMNFSHMPELSWRYGYPFIIILSIAIVTFCIWLFKKKKYW